MDRAKIKITGFIGYDTDLEMVQRQLSDAGGKPLTIETSSIGGNVETGTGIFNAIADYANSNSVDVEFVVMGWAESVASYITTINGATVKVHPNTLYMYHNPTDGHRGDYRSMQKKAAWLDKMTAMYAGGYSQKSGKTDEEIRTGMDAETYLLGQEIVDAGFADELLSGEIAGMSAPKEELIRVSREEYAKAMVMVSGKNKKEEEQPALPPKTEKPKGVTMSDEKKKDETKLLDMERARSRACMAAMAALPGEYHKQIQQDFEDGREASYFDGMCAHFTMVGSKNAETSEKKKMEMAGKDTDEIPELNIDQNDIKPGMQMVTPGKRGQKVQVG